MEGLTGYTKAVMHIIRMEDFKRLPKKRKHKRTVVLFGVLLVATGLLSYNYLRPKSAGQPAVAGAATGLRQFSNEEFKALAKSMDYPNTQPLAGPPAISGNDQADSHIRAIAQEHGYQLMPVPAGNLVEINEPRLEGNDMLQPQAAAAWQELKAAAQKDGIPLSILSAYRSPEFQRSLFMKRLLSRAVSVQQVAAGQGGAQVQDTMEMTAVPGYSVHHTGYAIDLWCEDRTGSFRTSRCYEWITANNHQKAKECGWIPSYPDGVLLNAQEPEPWEYVWVGKEVLKR